MNNDYTLIILSPMAEEDAVLRTLVGDLGYTAQDITQLAKEKKLFLCETGMGAINILHTVYNNPHFFSHSTVDILLTGFAGALSADLHKGDTCQVSRLTHFTFMDFQGGGGDFEFIPTPAPYHEHCLTPKDGHAALKMPHICLIPEVNAEKTYNLISVPALLQGYATKEYLCAQGLHIVDMEGFALASALYHLEHASKTQSGDVEMAQSNIKTQKNIHLDIIKVITDCPDEKFDFAKLDEYKTYLRRCDPIRTMLRDKFSKF